MVLRLRAGRDGKVKGQESGGRDEDCRIAPAKIAGLQIAAKSLYAEAGEKEQANDRDAGEGVVDMINSVDERKTQDHGRRNDPEDEEERRDAGDTKAPRKVSSI